MQHADDRRREEQHRERRCSEEPVPGRDEKDAGRVADISPPPFVAPVLWRIAVQLEEDALELSFHAEEGVDDVAPVARLDGMRVLLDVVRIAMVATVDHLP